jgi:hypothetical protein
VRRLLLVPLLLAVMSGCSGDESSTAYQAGSVYFLLDENVWPASRDLPEGEGAAEGVVAELVDGPTSQEAEIGLTSAFPEGVDVTVADGVARVESESQLTTEQLAQLVYSLTQPAVGVTSVESEGRSYTRADFEEQTPSVLVESPLAFEEVAMPITAAGTANTFEATFHYVLVDSAGTILDEDFVTATSGTGTRGTFEFTTADVDDVSALVVFERSAEDGSRMREVRIPLTVAS